MKYAQTIQPETIYIDGHALNTEQVMAVARGWVNDNGKRIFPEVKLNEETKTRLATVRNFVERNWLSDDAPVIYGFNTGVGPLKDHHISSKEIDRFQENMIAISAADIGDPAPEEVVRGTMLIRANAFAKGVSGIRVELL